MFDSGKEVIKVLVVDDEQFNYRLFQQGLKIGFNVQYASTGEQCLNLVAEEPPDVILLDICMPGIDGIDICRILKNTPQTRHIPVVIITGLEGSGIKESALNVGCDGFFIKPVSMIEIAEQLRRMA